MNGNISSPVTSECNEEQPGPEILPSSVPVLSDMSNRNVPSTTISNNSKTPKLKSFHTILEKLSPEREFQLKPVSFLRRKENTIISNRNADPVVIFQLVQRAESYIQYQLDELEREQEQIDQQARELEKRLRSVMLESSK